MNVAELIAILKDAPQDAEVKLTDYAFDLEHVVLPYVGVKSELDYVHLGTSHEDMQGLDG